jgi:quinol monooxygenase YgiN
MITTPKVTGPSFVSFTVKNLEQSRAFYQQHSALGQTVSLWMGCEQIDGLYAAITTSGVPIAAPLQEGPFGRTFAIDDPDGYRLTVNAVSPKSLDTKGNCLVLINTFEVAPERAEELLANLSSATRETIQHLPGFLSANLHISEDRTRVVNYAQWESREHYDAMAANPKVKEHFKQAGAIATSFDPTFCELREAHTR